MKKVKIENIQTDSTQSRAALDQDTVQDYADKMKAGVTFPPVVVYHDGSHYWLADGFHRLLAAQRADKTMIDAEIRKGSQREALLHSVGANDEHGIRRTPADKRYAVGRLLADNERREIGMSNYEVAEACRVDEKTVRNVAKELRTVRSSKRTGKDGKVRDTSRIGKWEKSDAPEEKEPPKEQRKSRGEGIRHAHEAINALKRIPVNDGLRDEAFDTVIQWIETNR